MLYDGICRDDGKTGFLNSVCNTPGVVLPDNPLHIPRSDKEEYGKVSLTMLITSGTLWLLRTQWVLFAVVRSPCPGLRRAPYYILNTTIL